MHRLFKTILLLVAIHSWYAASAQHYVPDKNFGNCGTAFLFIDSAGYDEHKATVVLKNGKILLAGNFFHDSTNATSLLLIQYGANGRLDSAGFGTNGIFLKNYLFKTILHNIGMQSDSKIIAIGYLNHSDTIQHDIPAVFRIAANGRMDSSFHFDGVTSHRFDGVSSGHLVQAIELSDGRIVTAGYSFRNDATGTNGIGLMKLKTNGELDSLFGNLAGYPGRSRIDIDSAADLHLFLFANDFILPFLDKDNGLDTIKILKVLSDGNADNSFGTNGVLNPGTRSTNVTAIKQLDGKLLIGGTTNETGALKKMQLLRYTSNLIPDAGFGTNGKVIVPTLGHPNADNILHRIVQTSDSTIYIIGTLREAGFGGRSIIVRLKDDGSLDSTFNDTSSMRVLAEIVTGWRNIDTTSGNDFIISNGFSLMKFVPDTTQFTNLPNADFDFVIEKQTVFFENKSVNTNFHEWDFGDGNSSQQGNPTHVYTLPGKYSVDLIASGSCSGDDTTKTVEVLGLYKLTPDVGPDKGFVSCRIYGYGINSSSQVVLSKGSSTLTANKVFFDTASQTLQANFQFNSAPLGRYDLIVTTGTRNDTLPQSFEIQSKNIGKPWVQIVGPYAQSWITATGERTNTYRLEYGVSGNATQFLIPLALVVRGTQLNTIVLTPVTNRGDTTSLPDSMKPHSNGFYRMYDEISKDSVWMFLGYDQLVEPNTTHTLEFTLITSTMIGDFGIRAYIGNSLFDAEQLDTIYSNRTMAGFCDDKCISCMLGLAGFIPGPAGCLASVVSLGCSVSNFMNAPTTSLGDVGNLAINFAGATISCGTMTGSAFGEFLKLAEKSLFGFYLEQQGTAGTVGECAAAIGNLASTGSCNGPGDEDGGNYPRTGSFDPNIKIGPASYNTMHYININEPLVYTTQFENLSTATAPAFQVIVTDTLDKSVIDISSFRFTSVSIANEEYPAFTTKDSFAMDVPMPATGTIVRINGKVDTSTGVVTWKFISLDTLTMELVEDQFRGFLPPNIDSISGKGAVSFSVKQKPTNTHLTSISNKATIVFDFNAPIITPVWTNIVDTVKPQSQVLNQFRVLTDSTFSIKWSGFDADAGIRSYKIFVSVNDSAYRVLGVYGNDSTVVKGARGKIYKFISIARDSVDNIEEPPGNAINNPDAIFAFNSILPVKLLTFNAIKEAETAKLTWSTSTEINSSHFVVEHSSDGMSYSTIGTVRAAGASQLQNNYSYTDPQPFKGYNYYRLRMVDKDGKFEVSPVRSLRFDKSTALVLIPNPATNMVSISVPETGGIIRVINSTGETLKEMEMTRTTTEIDLSALAQGVYFITYTTKTSVILKEKLLIQRGF